MIKNQNREFGSLKLLIKGFNIETGGWRDDKHPRFLADFNGDGKDDLIGFASGGVAVSLSDRYLLKPHYYPGEYYFNIGSGWKTQNENPRIVGDINGDGKADIAGFAADGVYVSFSTGSKFTKPNLLIRDFGSSQGWANEDYPRFLADINGDGKADIVGFGAKAVMVALSKGESFEEPKLLLERFCLAQTWSVQNIVPRFMADVNGDGKPDIIGFSSVGVEVAFSEGSSFFTKVEEVLKDFSVTQGWHKQSENPRALADINGDGKADIIGFADNAVYVSYSTGSSFEPKKLLTYEFVSIAKQGCWQEGVFYPRLLGDIDGDGFVDIIGFGREGVYVSYNKAVEETKGVYIAKPGGADKIIIKDVKIDKEVTGGTGLDKCQSIILGFAAIDNDNIEDTIDISKLGCFSKQQITFKTIIGKGDTAISAIQIKDQKYYVACVYNFDADTFEFNDLLAQDLVILNELGQSYSEQC